MPQNLLEGYNVNKLLDFGMKIKAYALDTPLLATKQGKLVHAADPSYKECYKIGLNRF